MLSAPDDATVEALASYAGEFAVLGAGGKMGLHVALMIRRALDAMGRSDRVTAVSRFGSPDACRPFAAAGIETVSADLSEPDVYSGMPQADNVIFLAGVKFGTSSHPDLLQRMNVVLPQLVAEHFRRSRIVALSTGCVYSFVSPESGGATEESPTDPPGDYARSCLGREQAFIEASRRHGTPCALVRLNYSVEFRYGVLVDIARRVHAGLPVDVRTGYVNVIWQTDAVRQILRCLPLAASPPMVLNVTGSETLSVRELAQRFGKAFGRPALVEGTEAATAWLSNNRRAVELFGPPSTDVETMVRLTAEWIEAGGAMLDKPTHFETRDGNY